MVLIALKSQYVSLIVTSFSFLCELMIIVVLYNIVNYRECLILLKGKELNIRRHRRYIHLVAALAALLFLALEVVTSFVSDPAQIRKWDSEKCVSLDIVRNLKENRGKFVEGDIIGNTCQTTRRNLIFQQTGNVSEITGQTQCSDDHVYYTDIKSQTVEGRLPQNGTVLECVEIFCVFAFQVKDTVFISYSYFRETAEKLSNGQSKKPITFWRTAMVFNSSGLLSTFALRAAKAYSTTVSDPFELRRRAFLGSARRECPFVVEVIDATNIPIACISIVVIIWIASVMLFGITMVFLKRKIFFNISDPLHWAQHTFRRAGEIIGDNPVIMYEVEEGLERIYVSESRGKAQGESSDFIDDEDVDSMEKYVRRRK